MNHGIRPVDWAMSDDTGISSKTIFSVMMDCDTDYIDTPSDASDFGRCYRLLKLFPEWESRLGEVCMKYPKWKPLVREWGNLKKCYEDDEAHDTHNFKDLISSLRDECMIADGFTKVNEGYYTKKK